MFKVLQNTNYLNTSSDVYNAQEARIYWRALPEKLLASWQEAKVPALREAKKELSTRSVQLPVESTFCYYL